MLFIFSPLCWPAHSTRLLWWGYSPGTPNTDASLETQSMPSRLHFSEKKRERERTKKGGEQPCSWLHLPESVISIHCECKQTKPWKKKTWAEWRKKKWEEAKEEVGNSRQAKISWHKAWDTSHQLIYWYLCQTQRQKTHAGNKYMASRHTSTQRRLYELRDKLSTHFNVNLLYNSCSTKLSSPRIKWFSGSKPGGWDLPEGLRINLRGSEMIHKIGTFV